MLMRVMASFFYFLKGDKEMNRKEIIENIDKEIEEYREMEAAAKGSRWEYLHLPAINNAISRLVEKKLYLESRS